MRTVLIGIARMGSTRVPGKVMRKLGDDPVLNWVVTSAMAACYTSLDDFCIATSTDSRDDLIEAWCNGGPRKVSCFRGSEDDVLNRFYLAAKAMKADVAVRVTCDCPFIDPSVIDQVVALRETTGADYAGNVDPPTWPDGLDCEAITIGALEIANREATSHIDRDCVTTFITRQRNRFLCETLICPIPGMHKERWVLDTEEDWKLCQAIAMMDPLPRSWLQIKRYLDQNPELRKLNSMHTRNARYWEAVGREMPVKKRSYSNSRTMLERAENTIPLASQTFSKSKVQYPADSPLFVTHGDGGYCFDLDGNRYLDVVGGLLAVILGHRDPDVDAAIRRQLCSGISFSLATELEAELSELLCRLIPCAEMARFGKNGSDVTSAAVRLARAHTGREYIISSGYHGWHDWAVVNDYIRNRGVPEQSVVPLRHGDREALWSHAKRGDEIAGVIIEPETDPVFLRECQIFCAQTGALLIFDEIITGFRFDLGGAQKVYNVVPDLACFGKAMGNGMPISALVGKRSIMQTLEKTSYSGTFFGETLSLAAAIACIRKLEQENVPDVIKARQQHVLMNIPKSEHVSVTGTEWWPRLAFRDNDIKTLFIQEMAKAGVLIIANHNLSFAHDAPALSHLIQAYRHVLPRIDDLVAKKGVQRAIKNRPIPASANVRATA